MQAYSDPKRENDPHALPDVEVFYIRDKAERRTFNTTSYAWNDDGFFGAEKGECVEPGWYWWSCLPGCLPDSDPTGPFATEAEALADAQEGSDD